MAETIDISDDFDLAKIQRSGQCFRVGSTEGGLFRFVSGGNVLLIREQSGEDAQEAMHQAACNGSTGASHEGGNHEGATSHACKVAGKDAVQGARTEQGLRRFSISCSHEAWSGFWSNYFDLNRSYAGIRQGCSGKSTFLDEAMGFGQGLRVLRQDPWEMLITFIISQRKSVPAIATSVEALCTAFGEPIDDASAGLHDSKLNPTGLAQQFTGVSGRMQQDRLHGFPSPEQLASATEDELRRCGLGYRVPYVSETARMVASGELDLKQAANLSDAELFAELKRGRGVGDKVSNCVCLFGYGRTSLVPVDVWIARAINDECEGIDPFTQFGDAAGIMQQYAFYYMTQRSK